MYNRDKRYQVQSSMPCYKSDKSSHGQNITRIAERVIGEQRPIPQFYIKFLDKKYMLYNYRTIPDSGLSMINSD